MSSRAPRPSVDRPPEPRSTRSRASTGGPRPLLAPQDALLQRIELLETTAEITLRRHTSDMQAVKDRAAGQVKRAQKAQIEAEHQADSWKQQAEESKARAEILEVKMGELVRRAREGQVDAQCRFAAIEQIAVDVNWRPSNDKKRARLDEDAAAGLSTGNQSSSGPSRLSRGNRGHTTEVPYTQTFSRRKTGEGRRSRGWHTEGARSRNRYGNR